MKELGGFLEFQENNGRCYHENALALNYGRCCLEFFLIHAKIKKVYLPFFLCDTVECACIRAGVTVEKYHIGSNFELLFDKELLLDEYLYIVNYYGVISNDIIATYKSKYQRLIVDNVQSFFQIPSDGIVSIYSCRKYYGVPDGAFLYADKISDTDVLSIDFSFERMRHLAGRFELGAEEFYAEYRLNEAIADDAPPKKMSKFTQNLLRGIDHSRALHQRKENFEFLHRCLSKLNRLQFSSIDNCTYMYPLLVDNGIRMRQRLIESKIFIPTLWPEVLVSMGHQTTEYQLAENIIALPIDQRYGIDEMKHIAMEVLK